MSQMILRCPFCGGKPKVTTVKTIELQLKSSITCKSCLAKIERFRALNSPDAKLRVRELVITAWNSRL